MMGTRTPNCVQRVHDPGHGGGGCFGVHGDADQFRPGARQRHHLVDRGGHVGGIGVGHRLHDNRMRAPDLHTPTSTTTALRRGLQPYKPIVWILGGDWFADGVEDIWRSLAAGLAAGDGGTHLKTYHPKSPRSSSQWFHNDAWLDFNMLQTGHTPLNRSYDLIAADWNRTPVKPVVDGEGGYEGYNGIEPALVRRIAYCGVFAGAAGYTYGANALFGAESNPAARGPRRPRQRRRSPGRRQRWGPRRRGIHADEETPRAGPPPRTMSWKDACKCPPAPRCSTCEL
jgi:hypothetical protein